MSHLTPADRDRIIQLLADGQPLPATDRDLLFPPAQSSAPATTTGQAQDEASDDDWNSSEVAPPENRLCFSLYSTSLAVGKTYWPILSQLGLTYPQFLALYEIRDGITVNELGATIYLDSGTMTPLLKRLEGAGHIRRERDPKDERRVRLYLTEQGKTVREESIKQIRRLLANTSGWKRRDLIELAGQISRFRAALLAKAGETNRTNASNSSDSQ